MKLVLKTKRDYVRNHRLLWNTIIKGLEKKTVPFDRYAYKVQVCKELWPNDEVFNECFGCEWAVRGRDHNSAACNKHCLFAVSCQPLWARFCSSVTTNVEAIAIAEQIRDFPIRKAARKVAKDSKTKKV